MTTNMQSEAEIEKTWKRAGRAMRAASPLLHHQRHLGELTAEHPMHGFIAEAVCAFLRWGGAP